MRRRFSPVVFILTFIMLSTYYYAAQRLTESLSLRIILIGPFLLIWLIPILYWGRDREDNTRWDHWIHYLGYLSMGWLSFLLVLLVVRDLGLFISYFFEFRNLEILLDQQGGWIVVSLSLLCLSLGLFRARRGPSINRIEIPLANLPIELDGYSIVQISDLHVGPTIDRNYVEQVVRMTTELQPDLIALTGDIVDGSIKEYKGHVEPLGQLAKNQIAYLVLGNHDYYSGAKDWTNQFRDLGLNVLLNSSEIIKKNGASILVAGVTDPAVRLFDPSAKPDPHQALSNRSSSLEDKISFHLLLAHNPKLAPEGAAAGFDLQLSGHTHAGQFIPWTWVVRLVHNPHYWGLSKQNNMMVYVSAGTGTWGPPIRLGTEPELTLIRLRKK